MKKLLFVLFSFIVLTSYSQQSKIDSLKSLLPTGKYKMISIYHELGNLQQQPDSAISYQKRALILAEEIKSDSIHDILKQIGIGYIRNAQYDSASYYIEKAKLKSSFTRDSLASKAHSLSLEGVINETIGKTDLALINYNDGELVLKQVDSLSNNGKHVLSSIFINKGALFQKTGKFDNAILSYLDALQIKEQLGDDYQIMIILNNIAGTYRYLNDNDKAYDYYSKMYQKAKDVGEETMLMYAQTGLGATSYSLGNKKDALDYLKLSLVLAEKYNDAYNLNIIYENLSSIYEEENDLNKAENFGKKSIALSKQIQDEYVQVAAQNNLARVYLKDSKINQALELLNENEKICLRSNYKDYLKETYEIMSEAYNKNKNYKKALFFYKKFKILNDSIFNTEKTDLIAEKATKYETSEKDRTILEQKNEIQEQELDLQKKERRLLFTLIGFLVLTIILVVIYVNKLRRRIKHKDLVREFELGLNSYLKNKYVLNDDELNLWKKIFKGLSEKEQADVLFRSVNTIKTWRKSLYSKLKEVNPLNGNYSQKRAIVLYRDEEKLFERLSSE